MWTIDQRPRDGRGDCIWQPCHNPVRAKRQWRPKKHKTSTWCQDCSGQRPLVLVTTAPFSATITGRPPTKAIRNVRKDDPEVEAPGPGCWPSSQRSRSPRSQPWLDCSRPSWFPAGHDAKVVTTSSDFPDSEGSLHPSRAPWEVTMALHVRTLFQCPRCSFGSHEVGHLMAEGDEFCIVCLEEEGLSIRLQRWEEPEDQALLREPPPLAA
jgi:hypothetical protein